MQRSSPRIPPVLRRSADPINHLAGGRRRLSRPLAEALPADKPYFSAWTPSRARTVAKLLAGQLGFSGEPELLRHGHSSRFQLGDTTAKLTNPECTSTEDVQRELDFAQLCHDSGAPVLTPRENTVRTVTQGGEQFAATLWPQIPEADKSADPFQAGQVLATLHQLRLNASIAQKLAPVDPCRVIEQFIDLITPVATQAERTLLHERAQLARAAWSELTGHRGLPQVPIHLNHHDSSITGSPLHDGKSGPWIVNTECSGLGPAELDLLRVQLRVDRFGASPHIVDDFRAGYAAVARTEALSDCPELLRTLRCVWEPFVIAERCSGLVYDEPELEAEFHIRIDSLRYEPGDPHAQQWTHVAH